MTPHLCEILPVAYPVALRLHARNAELGGDFLIARAIHQTAPDKPVVWSRLSRKPADLWPLCGCGWRLWIISSPAVEVEELRQRLVLLEPDVVPQFRPQDLKLRTKQRHYGGR